MLLVLSLSKGDTKSQVKLEIPILFDTSRLTLQENQVKSDILYNYYMCYDDV